MKTKREKRLENLLETAKTLIGASHSLAMLKREWQHANTCKRFLAKIDKALKT